MTEAVQVSLVTGLSLAIPNLIIGVLAWVQRNKQGSQILEIKLATDGLVKDRVDAATAAGVVTGIQQQVDKHNAEIISNQTAVERDKHV